MCNNDFIIMCERLERPLGLMNEKPRFSWYCKGAYLQTKQISYRIQVYDIHNEKEILWDSGSVLAHDNPAVEYEGAALKSRGRYLYGIEIQVKAPDTDEIITLYKEDVFEMGILRDSEWHGKWLQASGRCSNQAPLFRSDIQVDTERENIRLYICGLGYFEAYINGERIGDSVLDPGFTNYNKRVLYRVFDISAMLRKGKNSFAVMLGRGWYGNMHNSFDFYMNGQPEWLDDPKLICEIWSGDDCLFASKASDFRSHPSAIVKNNIYDGEWYNANLETADWKNTKTDTPDWQTAKEADPPKGRLYSQMMPPIKEVKEIAPKNVFLLENPSVYHMVFDFGVNMAGYVQIKVQGAKGQAVHLKYAEVVNEDHTVNQKNLRGAKAEDVYILRGDTEEVFKPHFTYHGFRYVQVEMDSGVILNEITAIEVHSAVEAISSFRCSNDICNRIYAATMQTEKSNLHSIPTDCPQRDERFGWLNDMAVRNEEALFNFDMFLFYEKWLQDITDAQQEDGSIPDTAPYFYGSSPAAHISSTLIILPWNLYKFYGDRQVLKKYYPNMQRYIEFKFSERDEDGLISNKYMGDWAPPMMEAVWGWGENAVPKNIAPQLITTCYLYYDCMLMNAISKVLDKKSNAAYYEQQMQEIKRCINQKYFHQAGYYDNNSQGANTFPLFLGLVPEDRTEVVVENLVDDIREKHDFHITTGNQMTKYIYEVMTKFDLDDLALSVTTNTAYPSIAYMLTQGATTIWERFENMTGGHMNSHNHPMMGAFTVWFFKGLCGIDMEVKEDKRRIKICPKLCDELTFVEASHRYENGTLSCRWEKNETEIKFLVQIPWNSEADFVLPKMDNEIASCEVNGESVDTKDGSLVLGSGESRIKVVLQ